MDSLVDWKEGFLFSPSQITRVLMIRFSSAVVAKKDEIWDYWTRLYQFRFFKWSDVYLGRRLFSSVWWSAPFNMQLTNVLAVFRWRTISERGFLRTWREKRISTDDIQIGVHKINWARKRYNHCSRNRNRMNLNRRSVEKFMAIYGVLDNSAAD